MLTEAPRVHPAAPPPGAMQSAWADFVTALIALLEEEQGRLQGWIDWYETSGGDER